MEMLDRDEFFKKFSINQNYFNSTGLKWEVLEEIYDDYIKIIPYLEKTADDFIFKLIDKESVHSVRRRVKKPTHLIEKIIRKGKKYVSQGIDVSNYRDIVTDLIGVRILHLFKNDWIFIHNEIINTWRLAETPQINVRPGDFDMDVLKRDMEDLHCEIIIRPHGYRSVHYLIEVNIEDSKIDTFVEVQVRTVFEEAWSEIDHIIRYPYDKDNPILNDYLSIFNRIVGSADEMGTFIKELKPKVVPPHMNDNIEADNKYK
ncbi:GTP pyrophosphokinase [Fusobacterium sp. IOR10]|uniref:GTP pyrophosphokinase n=1 Tax=Fusobacterium sp. IOR10 TaxID=2665157 RepID=UPI00193F59A7|nr:GTP pyrophosphokinase [Fusobacterium sp. IOR10]